MAEVTIERLGRQGDGIAAGPIYVPRALPGEVVKGRVEGDRLLDAKIVTPSDQRVAAPCRHYKVCGGCAMQHANDAFVATWKQDIVRHLLESHKIETQFRPVKTSPPQSRRRAGFAARRTKSGALVGFHGRGSDVIHPVPDCLLIDPALKPGLAVAEDLAVAGASRKGMLSVLVTLCDNGLDVSVTGGKPLDTSLQQVLAGIVRDHRLIRLAWEGDVVVMEAPPQVSFDGIPVAPPVGAFLQATPQGEAALVGAVGQIVGQASHIVDLFAGCGTFSLPLARTARVHAAESSGEMLAALNAGWRYATGLREVTTETRDLFRRPLMADELQRYEAIVIDPPRAGAEAQIAEISKARLPVVAHVSCNPVTFARDAATLVAAGYTLDWVQVVDQFRWSAHVELVACFTLSHIAA